MFDDEVKQQGEFEDDDAVELQDKAENDNKTMVIERLSFHLNLDLEKKHDNVKPTLFICI